MQQLELAVSEMIIDSGKPLETAINIFYEQKCNKQYSRRLKILFTSFSWLRGDTSLRVFVEFFQQEENNEISLNLESSLLIFQVIID